jgi:hypothetical protein
MRKTLAFLATAATLVAFSVTAQAQIKCWTDAAGKRACGDAPPPGAKITTLKAPAAGEAPPPAAAKDAKDAKKGPLTPAEKEAENRKRQAEAKKTAEKADVERKDAEAKKENCDRAKDQLRMLESGTRISRTDAKGERYYLDDDQIAREAAQAREAVKGSCN